MSSFASRLPLALSTLVVAASTGACGPLLLDPDDVEFRESIGCANCGPNSPWVNDTPIQNVRLSGLPNEDGVSLLGLRPNAAAPLHTVTTDSREDLVAVLDGTVIASGAGLVGWQLVFEHENELVITWISAYDPAVPLLADEGRPMTTYAIRFPSTHGSAASGFASACPTFLTSPDEPLITVIRGETYDSVEKKVDDVDADWITLACADEAAYKTKRLGYGPMSALGPNFPAFDVDARDATLKMLTADYCGTGMSFTEQNHGIYYVDAAETVTVYEENVQLTEALWTAEGALCLDYPRLFEREKVMAACPLPYCGALGPGELAGAVWLSGMPPY